MSTSPSPKATPSERSASQPSAPRPRQHETRLQIYLVGLFRKHVKPWDAVLAMIANGGYRPPETVDLLARMGLVSGLPDLVLMTHRGRSRWIELKLERTLHHERTAPNRDQRELHDTLRWMEHQVDVVRDVKDLWAIVNEEEIPHTLRQFPPEQLALDFRRRRVPARASRPSPPALV